MANLEDSGLPGSTLSVPIDFWPALLGLALAELVDLSIVNLSVLKNDRGRAIRFSTLRTMCEALECEVGDLLVVLAPSD
ncbi:MAG: helix-turn-helix domain-containing protein [Microbacteriaceae bacterium]|nr:helix-turn-helix domain-containing protein [Microbacteriaceae bacterium]